MCISKERLPTGFEAFSRVPPPMLMEFHLGANGSLFTFQADGTWHTHLIAELPHISPTRCASLPPSRRTLNHHRNPAGRLHNADKLVDARERRLRLLDHIRCALSRLRGGRKAHSLPSLGLPCAAGHRTATPAPSITCNNASTPPSKREQCSLANLFQA